MLHDVLAALVDRCQADRHECRVKREIGGFASTTPRRTKMARTRSRAQHSPAAPLDPPAATVNEPVKLAPSTSAATSSSTSTAAPTTSSPAANKRKASKAPTGAKPKLRKAPRGQSPDRDETAARVRREDNDDGERDSVLIRRIGQKFSPGDGQLDYTISACYTYGCPGIGR